MLICKSCNSTNIAEITYIYKIICPNCKFRIDYTFRGNAITCRCGTRIKVEDIETKYHYRMVTDFNNCSNKTIYFYLGFWLEGDENNVNLFI